MVWGGVTTTGLKTPLVFIDEGAKINKDTYLKLLKENLLPWINSIFEEGGITLQQQSPLETPTKPLCIQQILFKTGAITIWPISGQRKCGLLPQI